MTKRLSQINDLPPATYIAEAIVDQAGPARRAASEALMTWSTLVSPGVPHDVARSLLYGSPREPTPEALQAVKAWALDEVKVRVPGSPPSPSYGEGLLIIIGGLGLGKTFAAAWWMLLRLHRTGELRADLAARGRPWERPEGMGTMWVNAPEFADLDAEVMRAKADAMRKADGLVIDELGAGRSASAFPAEILEGVLTQRKGKPTLISANGDLSDLPSLVGRRAFDRSTPIELKPGESLRDQPGIGVPGDARGRPQKVVDAAWIQDTIGLDDGDWSYVNKARTMGRGWALEMGALIDTCGLDVTRVVARARAAHHAQAGRVDHDDRALVGCEGEPCQACARCLDAATKRMAERFEARRRKVAEPPKPPEVVVVGGPAGGHRTPWPTVASDSALRDAGYRLDKQGVWHHVSQPDGNITRDRVSALRGMGFSVETSRATSSKKQVRYMTGGDPPAPGFMPARRASSGSPPAPLFESATHSRQAAWKLCDLVARTGAASIVKG